MVMTLLSPAQAEEHLSHVTQQFAQWRQSRSHPRRDRIPEPLWTEALTLADVLPLTRVARQLGLKPQALKRRRGDAGSAAVSARPSHAVPAFVEVTTAAGHPATAEVEVQRLDGTRLRIAYHDAVPSLAPLLQTFLESR
jgi:hypothetical protein